MEGKPWMHVCVWSAGVETVRALLAVSFLLGKERPPCLFFTSWAVVTCSFSTFLKGCGARWELPVTCSLSRNPPRITFQIQIFPFSQLSLKPLGGSAHWVSGPALDLTSAGLRLLMLSWVQTLSPEGACSPGPGPASVFYWGMYHRREHLVWSLTSAFAVPSDIGQVIKPLHLSILLILKLEMIKSVVRVHCKD